jgi:hypothetical protein
MTFAGKSLFKLIFVLLRGPLALGSCSSEAQFGFFQFGHTLTFRSSGCHSLLGAQCTLVAAALAVGRHYRTACKVSLSGVLSGCLAMALPCSREHGDCNGLVLQGGHAA